VRVRAFNVQHCDARRPHIANSHLLSSSSLQAGPDAVAHLTHYAPVLLTDPPPLLNTGRFELTGWAAGGGAGGTVPPHDAGPPQHEPGDPLFDAELDG